MKFEDGTPVTSQGRQVRRRAVAGQDDASPTGPTYFNDYLDLQGYTSPYKDSEPGQAGPQGDRDPGRPDDRLPPEQAVQRVRLLRPAAGDDPGAAGQGHRHASTRSTWSPRARTSSRPTTWARASRWSATRTGTRRPTRTARRCRTRSRSRSTSTPTTSTTGCISGDLDVDIEGTGVQPAAQGRILADPTLKANTDNAPLGPHLVHRRSTPTSRRWTTSTAARPCSTPPTATGYQRAYGGATGGDIATNLLPPVIPGARAVRPLPVGPATRATWPRPRTS